MMKIKLFLFTNMFLVIFASYDCDTNETVFLNINEIAFFSTTNYPLLMSKMEFNSCKLNFSLIRNSVNDTKITKLIVALYEISSFEDLVVSDIFFNVYNEFTYSLKMPPFNIDSIAEQGLILFEGDNEGCPMESISREQPYQFIDETQILHIQSSYKLNYKRKNACKWQFLAPNGYGLKVVVMHFSVSSQTQFRIKNTTEILANERSVGTYHPYYNDDYLICITLSKGDANFVTNMEFQAYITVVKKDFKVINQNCSTTIDYGEITWYQNGYANNFRCTYNLSIPNNVEIIVDYYLMALERNTDFVKVIGNNSFEVLTESSKFVIRPNKTGFENQVMFEFVSDGSLESLGFEMHFTEHAPLIDFYVKLSPSVTSYIIDTGLYTLISVETENSVISQTNDFIIYSSLYDGVPLYNNQSLTINIGSENCFNNPDFYKCEINVEKFVIFTEAIGSTYPILVVRLKTEKPKGCVFSENVYISNFRNTFPIVAISTSDHSCFITILLDDSYFVSHLWTTAINKNVITFIGTEQNKVFFQFNSTSANTWNNIRLYSPVITMKIPKNSSIYLILQHDLYRSQKISNFPFKSLITTPIYGVSKKTYNNYVDKKYIKYSIGNITVKFTAIDYNLSASDEFYFCINNEKLKINKTGDAVSFRNQNITLGFIYERNKQVNNGVMLLIEAIKEDVL